MDRPFVRGVANCSNFDHGDSCPTAQLVNIADTIKFALETIEANAFVRASLQSRTTRCSPVVYPRLARGGKSTFLQLLFDSLKSDDRYAPILISFSGSFMPREGESACNAITRSIACQLIDVASEEDSHVVCDSKALLQHIEDSSGGKAVILLIDELNQLGVPLDPQASRFLKDNFLDHANRALGFTSHLWMDVDYLSKGATLRTQKIVPLPVCKDMKLLRAMGSRFSSLTRMEAALHGYIPSLIYSLKVDGSTFRDRVAAANINVIKYENENQILGAFVRQVLDGEMVTAEVGAEWMAVVRKFDVFGSTQVFRTIEFPIGYIAAILEKFTFMKFSYMSSWYKHLLTYVSTTYGGNDWAMIVQFAVLVRCIEACLVLKSSAPCVVNFLGSKAAISDLQLHCVTIPGDITTPDDANSWLREQGLDFTRPTLIIATPSHSSFLGFDMFVYLFQPNEKPYVTAIQSMSGEGTPDSTVLVPAWIDKVYLMRGKAPDSCRMRLGKWVYLTKGQIKDFLGHSLRFLYPDSDDTA